MNLLEIGQLSLMDADEEVLKRPLPLLDLLEDLDLSGQQCLEELGHLLNELQELGISLVDFKHLSCALLVELLHFEVTWSYWHLSVEEILAFSDLPDLAVLEEMASDNVFGDLMLHEVLGYESKTVLREALLFPLELPQLLCSETEDEGNQVIVGCCDYSLLNSAHEVGQALLNEVRDSRSRYRFGL